MKRAGYDVIVIGGGPGGYSAALRGASHGLSCVVIEAADIGGTCLNIGCIPSKAIIHAADTYANVAGGRLAHLGIDVQSTSVDASTLAAWTASVVDRLRRGVTNSLTTADVDVIHARAELVDAHTVITHDVEGARNELSAANVIIATGARPVELPTLPFGGSVISSNDVFALTDVPAEVVVVGAGYIGLELGTALRKLGARVTIVEAQDRILSQFDRPLVRPVETRLRELDVDVLVDTRVTGPAADGVHIITAHATHGRDVRADLVLVTIGRTPLTTGFGLERLGLAMNGAFIAIDHRCQTSVPGVYAVGDVTGEPMLAHRAIAQAHLVADVIGGIDDCWDHQAVPAICFTDPEVFAVGTDVVATPNGIDQLVVRIPFGANGRAMTLDDTTGFVRLTFDPHDERLLGADGVGAHVAELAMVCGLAIEMDASIGDLAATIVAHPTLGESIGDAVHTALLRQRTARTTTLKPQRPTEIDANPGCN